jgi:uncharacterized membrane protein
MQMMLNIKARLKNKTFLISVAVLTVALVYRVLSLFDIFPTASENEILELTAEGLAFDPTATDEVAE